MTPDPELHKADFDTIYDQPDPRAYFSTLEPFDYQIPQHGADLFAQLLAVRSAAVDRPAKILDVCCSYGIVATLLKTDLDIADVYAHYNEPALRSLSSQELTAADRRLLEDRRRPGVPNVVGLDVAENAVACALATGALDAGVTENLEMDDPSPALARMLDGVDLITTTGGIGYVSELTYDRLIRLSSDSVWVASFCLRSYDYGPIAARLEERGFSTEVATRTFPQRRFIGPEEQAWSVSEVRARGTDPSGKEDSGYHHAEFYLSRPAADVTERPMNRLLPDLF